MMHDNEDIIFDDTELNNLCAHYKDTYDIHLNSIKQRDTLFYALLIILAIFSLQVTATDIVNSALSSYANNHLNINIEKSSSIFGTLLWFLLFGFSCRYYQVVIQIEKQYDYIHHLEKIINRTYSGTSAFTREGKSYLKKYRAFSNWMWFLYTFGFPIIVIICITIRLCNEFTCTVSVIPSLIAYILVLFSTLIYVWSRHR